jgi:hypothetical protein
VLRVKVIIDVAVEVGRTVEPWTSADEYAACKPFRAIIAIGSAAIGSRVVITVWTARSNSNVYGNLGLCFGGYGRRRRESEACDSG